MASTPQLDTRKVSVGRTRPSAALQPSVSSPHTPLTRSISGLYGSPSASFRSDEENHLVLEIGSRFSRIGFAGDNSPRCVSSYSPEHHRRVGDYRQWALGHDFQRRRRKRGEHWGQDYELWAIHAPKADFGLMEDKIERLVREVESKYLILDNRQKKITLAISSSLPRPLLSSLLKTLFNTLQATTINLLPSAVMAVVGAGVRSALVVDIGWEETAVTAVCEYREVLQRRSIRAGKALSKAFWDLLNSESARAAAEQGRDSSESADISFDETEEIMARLSWCRLLRDQRSNAPGSERSSGNISIPLTKLDPPLTLDMPFEKLASPVEQALLARDGRPHQYDDQDLPLPLLIYRALLHLPMDVRNLCMARIVFTGGISNTPGLKRRLIQDLTTLVEEHAWNPVKSFGSAAEAMGRWKDRRLRQSDQPRDLPQDADSIVLAKTQQSEATTEPTPEPLVPAHLQQPEHNFIDEKLSRSGGPPPTSQPADGSIRAVDTLGAWAGASLISGLRIKGHVEIDKDRFLQHGFSTALPKHKDASVEKTRASMAGPGIRAGGEKMEKGALTLGVWA